MRIARRDHTTEGMADEMDTRVPCLAVDQATNEVDLPIDRDLVRAIGERRPVPVEVRSERRCRLEC